MGVCLAVAWRWTPEVQLLLCLSRVRLDPDHAIAARQLLAGIEDWPMFFELAAEHGMAPLVSYHLTNLPAPVPLAVRERAQRELRSHATRNMQLAGELIRVLGYLRQQQITAAAYKGVALARQFYGRQVLRQVSDVDILVPQEQVPRAGQLLAELGYRPIQAMTPRQERALLHTGCELALWSPDKRVQLEIHWNVAPAYVGISVKKLGLWDRLQTMDWDGTPVAVPSTGDLLILLCVHGAKHRWQELKWIGDLHALVGANPQLDWPALMAAAQNLGTRRVLLLGLRLTHELYGLSLPGEVHAAMAADGRLARLSRAVYASLFVHPHRPHGPLRSSAFQLSTRDSTSAQIRSGLALLLQPNARDLAPNVFPWTARLRRPLRLLAEHLLGW